MRAALILALADADPAATVADLDPAYDRLTVVCRPGRRQAVVESTAEFDPRVIVDTVPRGGLVSAMRAGLRAIPTTRAFVTTPELPVVGTDAQLQLQPEGVADACLARIGGERYPPLGGYAVDSTVAACDTTLATGSRRLSNVFARLSVTTASVSELGCGKEPTGDHVTGKN